MNKWRSWIAWLGLTAATGTYLGCSLVGPDKTAYLPGKTTDGHYQIELACDACHGEEGFGGADALQKACVRCHGAELREVEDSHPRKKFTDPRNAERVAVLDATYCATCHREHRPEITADMGVTLPADFCELCHYDVAEDRESHEGMAFDSCAAAGCHNFHDNKALYEDFLVKHGAQPSLSDEPRVRQRNLGEFFRTLNNSTPAPLFAADQDAPSTVDADPELVDLWAESAHATGGVNCKDCHANKESAGVWTQKPSLAVCARCHAKEHETYGQGKHGLRLALDLSPMSPALARLPMKEDVHDAQLGCNSCHASHGYDSRRAAVEACLGCHDDEHSRNYKNSQHYTLWQKEAQGTVPAGSGVSCATCHLPRIEIKQDGERRILVQHNQNFNLEPNEKMIRSVCLECHGLAFAIDSLADEHLINTNFAGVPSKHIESIDMAIKREIEKAQEKEREES